MRRLLIPAMFLLFILPAVACGSSTGTATKTGNAITATQSATVVPVVTGSVTTSGGGTGAMATARSAAPSTAASSAPSAVPAATGLYGPNTLVSVKNWDMAVNRVERPGKELVWSDFNNKSVAAGEWVIVVFDLKNTGNTNFGINLTDVQLNAPGGITYKPSTDGGALTYSTFKKAQMLGGQVPPGVSVQYQIVFDVAPNTAGLTFQFNQDTKPKFTLP
jgi:Rieske Fe-S protein